jgi:general secretion pathway protein E
MPQKITRGNEPTDRPAAGLIDMRRQRTSLERELLARKLATEEEIDAGLAAQRELGGQLGEILVRQGVVEEEDLLAALSHLFQYPVLDSDALPGAVEVGECAADCGLTLDWLVDRSAFVWRNAEGDIWCCARDPFNPLLRETLDRVRGGSGVVIALTRTRLIDGMMETLRQLLAHDGSNAGSLRDLAEDAPTVTFVDGIIGEAVRAGASDIHIEPEERQLNVRFRIDGVLRVRSVEPRSRFDAISSRLKLLSGMDIAERRLPQDGRMSRRIGGEKVDFRVSTLPGAHGESLVLRLLRSQKQVLKLDELGMVGDHHELLGRLIHSPHGILLVSGPTGSGKTTTLYASLHEIKDGRKKIVTVEDPVEYMMEGVHQVQVRADIGYDFARALRSILRQDPDIIMVGEIRDAETASIAVQAALTGHLVLSTVHTNDALGAVARLVDMGVEPFLLSSALRGVLAQRLVRRLSPDRSEPYTPDQSVLARLPPGSGSQFRRPLAAHADTAYSGRVAVYEMVAIDGALEEAISAGAPASELRRIARATGMRTLFEDALMKASYGLTSVQEAMRVAMEDGT